MKEIINLHGKDVPRMLYKYRECLDDNHLKLLFEQKLYFPSRDKFNDPFDMCLPFKFKEDELTKENILKRLCLDLKFMNPNISDDEILIRIKEMTKNGLLLEGKILDEYASSLNKDLANEFGIVSLCTNPKNLLMWSQYSKSHTGFCVGLDVGFIVKNFGQDMIPQKVEYVSKVPEIGLFENGESLVKKLCCTKFIHWEYEQEYRILRNYVNKEFYVYEWAIREVYIGAMMDSDKKQELIPKLFRNYANLRIFQCDISKSGFDIDIHEVDRSLYL